MPEEHDTRPQLPPEMPSDEETRMQSPANKTRGMPPVIPPPPPHRAPMPVYPPEKPKRGQPPPPPLSRRDSPLYLPIWSVLFMLMSVVGIVACMAVLVYSLGGHPATPLPPRFVVLTAQPSETIVITIPVLAAPTNPAGLNANGAVQPFVLEGPTLAPVIISPTPESIALGKIVVVTAEDNGLNVRSGPGTQNDRLFVAPAGQRFIILDGPVQADGFTWWKLQNVTDSSQIGWGAAIFLEIPTPTPLPQ